MEPFKSQKWLFMTILAYGANFGKFYLNFTLKLVVNELQSLTDWFIWSASAELQGASLHSEIPFFFKSY